jgi:hypothetical protein
MLAAASARHRALSRCDPATRASRTASLRGRLVRGWLGASTWQRARFWSRSELAAHRGG